MNVRLTPQQEEFVNKQVEDGRYLSASEVIREGLRLLADEEKWKTEVRNKIAIGLEQMRNGQVVDGEEAVKRVLEELRKPKARRPE
jgi:antitoxin ParD1/3/4